MSVFNLAQKRSFPPLCAVGDFGAIGTIGAARVVGAILSL
jgi:hypothetical protein